MSLGSPRSVLAHSHADANGQGLTAVVLGAGVAGLCAAHVLCSYFARVVLVEGDIVAFPAPEEGETRAQAIMKVGCACKPYGGSGTDRPTTPAPCGLDAGGEAAARHPTAAAPSHPGHGWPGGLGGHAPRLSGRGEAQGSRPGRGGGVPAPLACPSAHLTHCAVPPTRLQLVRRGGVPLDLCRNFRFFDFGGTYVRCPDSPLKVSPRIGGRGRRACQPVSSCCCPPTWMMRSVWRRTCIAPGLCGQPQIEFPSNLSLAPQRP